VSESPLGTAISLMLDDAAPAVAAARADIDPAGAARIGLHLTLLYPFVRRDAVTQELLEGLRGFFAERAPIQFGLARLEEFQSVVAYIAPEPDGELKELMRSLWAKYPDTPPYGGAFSEPVPHATFVSYARTSVNLDQVRTRVAPLLPIACTISAASLLEEYEPERWRELESIPFGVAA
jgi:2'-5' RNA ligase